MNRRELIKLLSGGLAGIPAVKSVELLELKSEDTIVLKYPERLRASDAARISDLMRHSFPGHKIMLLEGGAEIEVLRKL